jgi:hypothetical protein
MDPAIDLPILPPLEERARGALFTARVNPVIDPVNIVKVIRSKTCGSAESPVRESDADMRKDVLPVSGNPRYKIIDNPFLVPSPLLAALSALAALLGHSRGIPGESGAGLHALIFSPVEKIRQKKTTPFRARENP